MTTNDPMALMASGIPITLILDLADATHMPSHNILQREQGNADWLATCPAEAPTHADRPLATSGAGLA